MSSSISQLVITTPMGVNQNVETEFVEVEAFQAVRYCLYSDAPLQIVYEWSADGRVGAFSSNCKVAACQWKTEVLEVIMPYLRISLRKINQQNNLELELHVYARGRNMAIRPHVQTAPPPPLTKEPEVEERLSGPRFKSPFARKKSDAKPTTPLPVMDFRLPQYIPPGCILFGSRNGRVEIIPKGQPGEVLMFGELGPVWIDHRALFPQPPQISSQSSPSVSQPSSLPSPASSASI